MNRSNFVTVEDLRHMDFPKSSWVVEGLLRTGRKRPSLLGAKPETGKSTLARQLAVAISQGKPFLGYPTTRGEVIYWQTEDEPKDVLEAFNLLGHSKEDEHIYVFHGDPSSSGFEDIAKELSARPKVNLVIIETLDDLLQMDDIKENTAARIAFKKLETQVTDKFNHRVAFLALHHLKKAETAFAGDALLGASNIRGRTDAKIYLQQLHPDDERRIIHTTGRLGAPPLPKTFLVFDPSTGLSTLGETVAKAALNEKDRLHAVAKDKVFDLLATMKTIEHQDLVSRMEGAHANRLALLQELVSAGLIDKSGKGKRNSPFTYSMSSTPLESIQ